MEYVEVSTSKILYPSCLIWMYIHSQFERFLGDIYSVAWHFQSSLRDHTVGSSWVRGEGLVASRVYVKKLRNLIGPNQKLLYYSNH
jgi:hypothetical protein